MDAVIQAVQFLTGLLFNPGAPQINQLLCGGRRGFPGEAFTHHQCERIFQWCIFALVQGPCYFFIKTLVQHGVQVGCHARHGARAESFDAGLLDRFIDSARLLALRQIARMYAGRMIGKPHRHGVGQAARNGQVSRSCVACDLRQPCAFVGNAGMFGTKGAGKFRLLCNSLHRERQCALEVFCRCFTIVCHWVLCCPPVQAMAKAADDSGNSSPKQR